MKTIKVIDLLNKMVNGEELPKTIKYQGVIYNKYYEGGYFYTKGYEENTLLEDVLVTSDLIEEVEIIEEEKEIEKLDKLYILEGNNSAMPSTLQDFNNQDIAKKINELIDAVNELKKDK